MKNLGILVLLVGLVMGVVFMSGSIGDNDVQAESGSSASTDITGAWHGTYTSGKGNGEWSWVIKKSADGYTGILTTTKPYNGENVPIFVTLKGKKITVGWVTVGVVFEGTISGDKMSGKWKFQNGMDGGNWRGVRGESSITPKETSNANQAPPNLPEEATSLPVYPGSQESGQYNMWAMMTGFSSQFSEFHASVVEGASPSDVINWYKSQFSDYTVSDQGTANAQGTAIASLMLKKGNTGVGVMAFEQEGKTVYFVGKAIMPEEEGASLPNYDMASGEEPLQRYPGSVMLVYTKQGDFPIDYEITYGTNDAYDKVADWFKRTLQSQGWNITYQSGSSDSVELVFKKDDDEVTVWVDAPSEGTAYTEITVSYTKSNLPDHDLANGTEPLPRYPGAVMIDYHRSSMTFQGSTSEEIKADYLAPGTFSGVKKWYRDQLNQMFSNVYEDEYSIESGGQIKGTMVTVRIEFTKYSKFTEVWIDYITGE